MQCMQSADGPMPTLCLNEWTHRHTEITELGVVTQVNRSIFLEGETRLSEGAGPSVTKNFQTPASIGFDLEPRNLVW